MAYAPQLAQTLARRPAALDALLDSAFFRPFEDGQGADAFPRRWVGPKGSRKRWTPPAGCIASRRSASGFR
jgi:glutamate-ammonia-ligase adenylyltransferase